jgi:hypothetical protein
MNSDPSNKFIISIETTICTFINLKIINLIFFKFKSNLFKKKFIL